MFFNLLKSVFLFLSDGISFLFCFFDLLDFEFCDVKSKSQNINLKNTTHPKNFNISKIMKQDIKTAANEHRTPMTQLIFVAPNVFATTKANLNAISRERHASMMWQIPKVLRILKINPLNTHRSDLSKQNSGEIFPNPLFSGLLKKILTFFQKVMIKKLGCEPSVSVHIQPNSPHDN